MSPRNSEFSSHGYEPSLSAPPPPQPNGVPRYGSDGLHPPPVPMETSTEELRERAFSVTEETRVLDEALSRSSTASLEGSNEIAMAQPQVEPERGGTLDGGTAEDRSKFEKLETEDMETGGGGGSEVSVAAAGEEEVRRKPPSHVSSSQDEDSRVRLSQACQLLRILNVLINITAGTEAKIFQPLFSHTPCPGEGKH